MLDRKRKLAQAVLLIACTTGFTVMGSNQWTRSAGTEAFVLSEDHAEHLDKALNTKTHGKLAERLDFQGFEAGNGHIIVRYGHGKHGETRFAATLQHPSSKTGAAATLDGFAIHEKPGPIHPAALIALTHRLKRIDAAHIWVAATPSDSDEQTERALGSSRQTKKIQKRYRNQMHRIRQAFLVDELDEALNLIGQLSADQDARTELGLDLVERWWELGQKEKAINTLSKWRQEAKPSRSLITKWRARALLGKERGTGIALHELQESGELCDGAQVAKAMALTGQVERSREFLRKLLLLRDCFDARHQQILWLLEDGELEEADTRSQSLLVKGGNDRIWHLRASTLRARVLLQTQRPKEAAAILDDVASNHPESNVLSLLLRAYGEIAALTWLDETQKRLLTRLEQNQKDSVARLLLGVVLHRAGKYLDSDNTLGPLQDIFPHQPEIYIYLGLNALNQDNVDEALGLVEKAYTLQFIHPDIYHARAEILRGTEPKRALEDLYRYLAHCQHTKICSAQKQDRVMKMAQALDGCIRNKQPNTCAAPWVYPMAHKAQVPAESGNSGRDTDAFTPLWIISIVGALLLFGWLMVFRNRKT